jgi:hypothetical protein
MGDGWLSTVTQLVWKWVAKLVAHLLATAALWFESGHLSKIQNGRHKQRSGQHTLARQKYKKDKFSQKNKKIEEVSEFSVGLEASPVAWMYFVGVYDDIYDGFWPEKKFLCQKPKSRSESGLDPDSAFSNNLDSNPDSAKCLDPDPKHWTLPYNLDQCAFELMETGRGDVGDGAPLCMCDSAASFLFEHWTQQYTAPEGRWGKCVVREIVKKEARSNTKRSV